MKIFFLLAILILTHLIVSHDDLYAAFVQYRDEYGKIHYVNTQYSRVPDRYRGQVEAQLKKIEQDNLNALNAANPITAQETTPQSNMTATSTINTAPLAPLTAENRLSRFTEVLQKLQTIGYFPPSVNVNSGVISYRNRAEQTTFVTAETLSTVPPQYLSQIDEQILNMESMAQRAANEKPLIAGTPVEVFTKSSCPDCVRLLTFLEIKKIKFLNYHVETTSQGSEFLQSLGGDSSKLPQTRVNNRIIAGVDIPAIEKAMSGIDDEPAPVLTPPTVENINTERATAPSRKKGMAAETDGFLKINPLIGQRK